MLATLLTILSQKRYLVTAVVVFILYVIVYLAATQFLIFVQRVPMAEGFFELKILENWQELMFRQRAPFLFESIGALYVGGVKIFISIPNILIAALLAVLVSFNISVSYYSFRALSLRGARGIIGLLGTVPAIVSGSVCCVPTLILVIGLQLTATLAAVWSFFIPLSFVLLFAALWWALYKVEKKRL